MTRKAIELGLERRLDRNAALCRVYHAALRGRIQEAEDSLKRRDMPGIRPVSNFNF